MTVQTKEKKKPVLKKGSGIIRGPTPRRRLMAVKAAEFRGEVILLSRSPMGINITKFDMEINH